MNIDLNQPAGSCALNFKALLIFSALAICQVGRAADWHLEIFDKAQALLADSEHRERTLLCATEPQLTAYYDLDLPYREACWRLDRRALILKLASSPPDAGIEWKNPWVWSSPIQSTQEELKLVAQDKEFQAIREEKLRLRDELRKHKTLSDLRNAEYRKQKEKTIREEQALHDSLMKLQKQIDQRQLK